MRADDLAALAERLLPAHVLDQPDMREMLPYSYNTKLLIMQAPERARLDSAAAATPVHLLRALCAGESDPAIAALSAFGISRD